MLAGLYVVRCYISCLPRLCSVLLHGEKKHKKWFMNINEQAGIPNLNTSPPFFLALAIYTRSPSAYNALRSFGILQLPGILTLKTFTSFNIETPGMNEERLAYA